MDKSLLRELIQQSNSDEQYSKDRKILYENYEWLEAYWRNKYNRGDQSIDSFILDEGFTCWQKDEIRKYAKILAENECVGSSRITNYEQNLEIAKATMYLRYFSGLFANSEPSCVSVPCREYKKATNFCTEANGRLWTSTDYPYSSFKALMYIVRQVRNNLFHGHKMTLIESQYSRNKLLVSVCSTVAKKLIDDLIA
jgi:hypothetical protein